MSIRHFKHYTSLSSLINILTHKKMSFSNPTNWEDRNDSYYLEIYGEKKGIKTLLVLCFTTTRETSHHWKIYAPGKHGVCVIFDAQKMLEIIKNIPEIRHNEVQYKYVRELEKTGVKIADMPFLKRKAFIDEKEYRLVYQNKNKLSRPIYELPIEIDWIFQISINNSMPKYFVKSVSELLHSINGCSKIKIIQTSLNENTKWKELGKNAT